MKKIHSRLIALLLFAVLMYGNLFAQTLYLDQSNWNGQPVYLAEYNSDNLDVHHYGIACYYDGTPTAQTALFLRGNPNDNNQVNFWHDSYSNEVNVGKRFPNLNDDRTQDLIWIFYRAIDAQSANNTSGFFLFNYKYGKYVQFQRYSAGTLSDYKQGLEVLNYVKDGTGGLFSYPSQNREIKAWRNSGAWSTSAVPAKFNTRIYEAGLTHRENAILKGMKRSVGMVCGADNGDFTLIDAEINKNLVDCNYPQLRTWIANLKTKYSSKSTVLPEGFYRIRSGANTSKNTGRVLYVDGSTPKWKTATGGDDEIWRVKNSGNGYLLTHYTTGLTLASATSATSASTQTFTIEALAQTDFPGHYAIHK
ncbi:MAG: hypothetical protein SOY99_01420, partial [Alloprevotella sp.]|nr:hypothetical protein [Alloprevotella sp.]